MDNTNNIIESLYKHANEIWVSEWYITLDGHRQFNHITLKRHLLSTAIAYNKKKPNGYGIIGFANSLEEAHVISEKFAKNNP